MLKHLLHGSFMPLLLLGVGFSYTLQTNFFQFRYVKTWLRSTLFSLFSKNKEKEASYISPFAAMSSALAGSMGIGNIVGVSAALAAGGPGAILWMWISAFLGMMTKYAEIILGFHYRKRNPDGSYSGGPMYYLKEGLKSPFLSFFFSICCILASLGMGNMTQGNSMAEALFHSLHIPPVLTGLVLAVMTALVILGGAKRIASISAILIPFMSLLYLLASGIVVGANIERLPAAFLSIFQYGFGIKSVLGGIAGYHLRNAFTVGITRGVFSNEAGLGSAVIAHAASSTKDPVLQGMWGIFEVFADTIVVCTLTALVILTAGIYNPILYANPSSSLPFGIILASESFESVLGTLGTSFLAMATVIFAFATIISWANYGAQCVLYTFGKRFLFPFYLCYLASCIFGCVLDMQVVWDFADLINILMALPNLLALMFLSKEVIKETQLHFP